jgi:hypothetical protein
VSRRAAASGCDEQEHKESGDEGQGVEDMVASVCEAVADR